MIGDSIQENFWTTWCVKITQRNTYITFGDSRALVYLYKFGTWEQLKIFRGHAERVRCMNATLDERIIITGGVDNKIFLWDIAENRHGLELSGHTDWVKAFIISEDTKFLYSMSDDCSIKTWRIPKFDNYCILEEDAPIKATILFQMGIRYPENIYFFDNKILGKIDRSKNNNYTSAEISNDIRYPVYAFNPVNDNFCLISGASKNSYYYNHLADVDIQFYELDTITVYKTLKFSSYGIYSVVYSLDGVYLIFGERYRCSIYRADNLEAYHIFTAHKTWVTLIVQSPNSHFLFSADEGGIIKSYDFFNKSEIKALIDPLSRNVKKMLVSSDNEYFIVLYQDNNAGIWATSKMIKINQIDLKNVIDIQFPIKSQIIFCLYENFIRGIHFPSLSKCFELELRATKFCFSSNFQELLTFQSPKIYIYKNPLLNESISAYGNIDKLYNFYQYVGKVIAGKIDTYESFPNTWIIEPFHINMMHIYAYYNKIEYLEQCMSEGTGFILSRSKFSPLDICLELNMSQGIDFYISQIKKLSKSNHLFICILENSINRICNNDYTHTSKLIDIFFTKSIDTTLTKYHHTYKHLPIISLNRSLFIAPKSFMKIEEFTSEGTNIYFQQTYFKFNMVPGSQESINFIKSIISTKNENIFNTEFIQIILYEKWKRISIVLYIQAFVYITYLALLSAYSSLSDGNVLMACFVLNIILILYEFGQMITGGIDYWEDLWNYIDLIRSALMTLMFLQDLLEFGYYMDFLVAVVLFFSWIRGISYFRISDSTRYYINLIYAVIIDVFPFLTIVFYSTLAFSLIFGRLLPGRTYFSVAKNSWEINVGGFNTDGYDSLMYLAFFLYTVINPIIMLNLLISVMSDTFKRVNSQSIIADNRELAGMILEAELILLWKRKDNHRDYLHLCKGKEISKVGKLEPLGAMKKKISILTKNQEVLSKEIKEIKVNQEEFLKGQQEMKNSLENILQAINSKTQDSKK